MMPITGWIIGEDAPAMAGSVDVGPDLALHRVCQPGHEHQEQDNANTDLLAFHHLRDWPPGNRKVTTSWAFSG